MFRKKSLIILISCCLILVMLTACSSSSKTSAPAAKPAEVSKEIATEGSLTIKGLDTEKSIDIKDLLAMDATEVETESVKSSGEVVKNKIKGILLQDILSKYDTREENYTGVRMIAGDGYSIVAPKDIIDKRDIVLVYEVDGKPLSEKAQPLMSAVPNERSMYWVKNLHSIELLSEDVVELSNIVMMETAFSKLNASDYTYYEDTDKAIKVTDLLSSYTEELDKKSADIKAVDGLEKEEDIEVLKTGYIKITGKDNPLFLSPELPKGMHVKEILSLEYKENIYVSLKQASKKLETKSFGDNTGILLKDLLAMTKIKKGKVYNLVASDGYEVEITEDMIEKGYIYERKKGGFTLAFDGMDKEYKIKGIEKITIVK